MNWYRLLFFFVVTLGLDVVVHFYLYHHLIKRPQWPEKAKMWATRFLILMAVLTPVGLAGARNLPRSIAGPLAWVAYIWMGVLLYLFLMSLVSEGLQALAKLSQSMKSDAPLDPQRRIVLARGMAAASGVGTLGVSGIALNSGLSDVAVKEVEVKLPRLPPALSGLTIAQLSDVHIGPTMGKEFTNYLVETVNSLKPDLVVITGDLVDGNVPTLWEHVAPLGGLKSRFGTYFVTGNHEYYSGVDPWVAALRKLGITVLRNQMLPIGDKAASIDLIGIEDYAAYSRAGIDPLVSLMSGRDSSRESILLAHQPRSILEAEKLSAGLQISGHTHGGQLWPFSAVADIVNPYLAGLYQHDPTTQIYVSRGTGFWGPPMRLLAPSEITKIVLVA